jgi:hypothetical protein
MTSTKTPTTPSTSPQTLRIGSRVRCTDDGVEGRITWANGVSVKIQWDDGEVITWRRDSLADRPIEILDPASDEVQDTTSAAPADAEPSVATESPSEESPPANLGSEEAATEAKSSVGEATASAVEPAAAESVSLIPPPSEVSTSPAITDATVVTPVKSQRRRKEPAAPKEKKISALDAAARVLAEAGQAMNCQEMIAAMAAKGYWSSPGGKTPAATLYSAILKEITTKGVSSVASP